MKQFDVYFEVFSKKMKTTVRAYDANEARKVVLCSVNILKCREVTSPCSDDPNDVLDRLKNIFGI